MNHIKALGLLVICVLGASTILFIDRLIDHFINRRNHYLYCEGAEEQEVYDEMFGRYIRQNVIVHFRRHKHTGIWERKEQRLHVIKRRRGGSKFQQKEIWEEVLWSEGVLLEQNMHIASL